MTKLPLIVTCAAVALGACHRVSIYELPPPPPPEERRDVSLIPGEEQREDEQRYLAARAAVMELYSLLSTKRYDEAVELMSAETRDFIVGIAGGENAADALVAGALKDGTAKFDPIAILLAPDVSTLSDSAPGVEEHETTRRKEIFATLPSGKLQTIVMITERGKWVLHRTRIPEPFDPPK